MKIVTAAEMRKIEKKVMENYGISGIVLMELAGKSLADKCLEIMKGSSCNNKILIFSGKGNNGGDGFVAARHLKNKGAEVKVILLTEPERLRGDANINFEILKKMDIKILNALSDRVIEQVKIELLDSSVVIDAIYGTGFKGMITGFEQKLVMLLDQYKGKIISADLPSGLESDTGKVNGPCVKADYTLTFGLPKIGLYLESGTSYCGNIEIVDISIPEKAVSLIKLNTHLITGESYEFLFLERKKSSHKGNYGHVFALGGSIGMTGAITLTCEGALHSGAGLVTAGIPKSLNQIMEIKLTEAMTLPLAETEDGCISFDAMESIVKFMKKASVLAVGPGISTSVSIRHLLNNMLPMIQIPCVIDADGLNVLAEILEEKPDFLMNLNSVSVLTPHPGEMARLTKFSIQEIQGNRLKYALTYAKEWGAVIVLKGANTIVASPDGRIYINTSGNPGMATGGTGDVLTGIISGFIAQGASPLDSAILGVYLHGKAGDLAAEEKGFNSMTAKDIINHLPNAFTSLKNT
ncbi:MAG: NAD(P)H-hydrate dehydratase [Clostridiales bacterium]|nr:NAD(P)H-hydrate dehydratase [Clostridiales bacterium]